MKREAAAVALLQLLSMASCGSTSATLSNVRKNREVPIATVAFCAPLMYQSAQEMVGPDAELARSITAAIRDTIVAEGGSESIDARFIGRSHSTLASALINHEAALALGVFAITEERKAEVDFSTPYYTSEMVLIINPLHRDLRPNTLGGRTIGVRAGTAVEKMMGGKFPSTNFTPFDTLDDAVLSLKRGEIDGVIDDRNMASYSLDTTPGVSHLEIVPGTLGSVECGVAVRKGDAETLAIVNKTIAESSYQTWLEEQSGELVSRVARRHSDRLDKQKQAETPRRLTIQVRKDANYDFDIYRMANLSFRLTSEKDGKRYNSSKIDFRNRVGFCSTRVPPGTYLLSVPRMNNWSPGKVQILPSDGNSVTITLRLGKGGLVEIIRG